ncbi:hypothetical protein HPB48_021322 [Haemaphysalis longicornis]|uniref:Endonuclease/exonuclease/phosphatase domain-containing protein n=1 Tax=Haemaphysalis longicornis TaxID=44386 RepID=A0A9J6FVM8_HAELO|nr:hypothetical protein HPB48_021322 [Haemaphysalis longicornis]
MALTSQQPTLQKRICQSFIFQWNARGLKGRLDDFKQRVLKYHFPIIVICEPYITSFRLSGYEQFSSDASGSSSKVLVCIRRDLTYIRHQVPAHSSNQFVAVTVQCKTNTFSVIAGYVSPRARFDDNHLDTIIDGCPVPHIIVGDFNAHHEIWGNHCEHHKRATSHELYPDS